MSPSDGDVLTWNSALDSNQEFAAPTGGSGDPIDETLIDAKGDLLAGTAADTIARLPVGANGEILVADSAETTGLKWTAAPGGGLAVTIIDAKGDLIVGSAADTVGRLAVGSDGQVLTADSGETLGVKWATGGSASFSGARVTKNAAQTIGNASEVALTWQTEDWDTDSYHNTGANTENLVVPTTAHYAVSAIIGFTADADGIRRVLVRHTNVAGTLLARVDFSVVSGAANTYVPLYTEVSLTASDVIVISVLHTAGNNLDILQSATHASIHRLG